MSRRESYRKRKTHRHSAAKSAAPPAAIVREAARVERLAYTRTQAAEALGVSRSTFDRRVLPLIETIEMPWGTRLIPVDELERVVDECRQPPRRQAKPQTLPGRREAVPASVVDRIRAEHAAGRSLGEIGRRLTADRVPTAHGGAQWWPSTVRSIIRRHEGEQPKSRSRHAEAP
jgi:hypothetical protein